MTVPYFLDTNILIYAAAGRDQAEQKRRRARELIVDAEFGTSTQVLQEFYVNVTRKIARPLSAERGLSWVERLAKLPIVETDVQLIKAAIGLSVRYRISYWDGAILAAAARLGTNLVYSEDLQHTGKFGTVQVVNPFR